MKFEEALTALRSGKKIRHPLFDDGVYLMGCRIGFVFNEKPFEERPISIVKMKGDKQHHDMVGRLGYVSKIREQLKNILTEEDYKKYHNIYTEFDIADIFDNDIFRSPQISLLLVMHDDWEIVK